MPVATELRENGQVNYFRITEPWTMDELFDGFAQAKSIRDQIYLNDSSRHIHTFVDLIEVKNAPPGVMRGRHFPGQNHPTRGEMVLVVNNAYIRRLVEAMLNVSQVHGLFFETLEDGWSYIRTQLAKTATNAGDPIPIKAPIPADKDKPEPA